MGNTWVRTTIPHCRFCRSFIKINIVFFRKGPVYNFLVTLARLRLFLGPLHMARLVYWQSLLPGNLNFILARAFVFDYVLSPGQIHIFMPRIPSNWLHARLIKPQKWWDPMQQVRRWPADRWMRSWPAHVIAIISYSIIHQPQHAVTCGRDHLCTRQLIRCSYLKEVHSASQKLGNGRDTRTRWNLSGIPQVDWGSSQPNELFNKVRPSRRVSAT